MPHVRNVRANIEWKGYSEKEVILPVCVRSPAMQGRNFTATLQAISEKADSIHLILIDTLDRYNFEMDIDGCRKRGNIWLETHLPVLTQKMNVKSITKWDEVLEDNTYLERFSTINMMYAMNVSVREMIDANAMYFVNARKERGQPFDEEKMFKNSVSYMIEEYAGTAVYGENLNYLPEIYWGIYVGNSHFFEQYNSGQHKLVLPKTLPLNINRLPLPFAGEPVRKAA